MSGDLGLVELGPEGQNLSASETVFASGFGCSAEADHVDVGAHNALASAASDLLDDVKKSVPVIDLRGLIDKVTGFNNGGHTLAPPTHIATLGFSDSCMDAGLIQVVFASISPDGANGASVVGTLLAPPIPSSP